MCALSPLCVEVFAVPPHATTPIQSSTSRKILNPLPTPGIPHGGPLGRRTRPEAAHAAPEVPVHVGCASVLNVDKALIGQLSPLGKLSPTMESQRERENFGCRREGGSMTGAPE